MAKIIVAYDKNRLIGAGNSIPWRIPEEMRHFKDTTIGCSVVMGRKTWNSLPPKYKPLPGRTNIVVSRSPLQLDAIDVVTALDIGEAVAFGEAIGQTWVIGGAQIYKYVLDHNLVKSVLVSRIKKEYSGDVHFPELDPQVWEEKLIKEHEEFDIVEYVKRS